MGKGTYIYTSAQMKQDVTSNGFSRIMQSLLLRFDVS